VGRNGRGRAGQAVLEFAFVLPIFLIVLVGLAELGIYLSRQISLIELSREAAGVLSRGASFDETFDAILNADGDLDLSSTEGKIILTEIELNPSGNPIITRQETRGSLGESSAFGYLPPGQESAPASIPNGMDLPDGMKIMGVELFSRQQPLGTEFSISGLEPIVLSSVSAF
jgi:hypothetical protein